MFGPLVPRRQFLRSLGGLSLCGLGLPSSAQAFEWHPITYDGRDYINLREVADFYGFDQMSIDQWQIWLRSKTLWMRLEVETDDLVINDCRYKLGHLVLRKEGRYIISRTDLCKIVDPVLRPQYQSVPDAGVIDSIVIDPGHGAIDDGKISKFGAEKFFVLELANLLKPAFEKAGLKVHLTRTDDTVNPTFHDRIALATNTPRSLFISLHFNASGTRRDTTSNGVETYAFTPHYHKSTNDRSLTQEGRYLFAGNESEGASMALATAVHTTLIRRCQAEDRAIRWARYAVLKNPRPSILIEGGYLSNSREAQRIADPGYRALMSQAIVEGVMNFRRAIAR